MIILLSLLELNQLTNYPTNHSARGGLQLTARLQTIDYRPQTKNENETTGKSSVSLDTLLFHGIQYSYEENYTKAEAVFREAMKVEPQNPAPYLLLASLYGLYMSDFSTDTLKEKFYAYCDTTVLMSKCQIESGDTSGLVRLWLAAGYGARAFYKIWNKNIISGTQDGLNSIDEFYKTIEIDSCIFDAYIGISGYNYFKYRLISFLPWVEDSSWEYEIKLACEKGKYLQITALAGYALLLNEEKRYSEACKVATQLVNKFPDSRTFRWIRVKNYCGMKEWELARDEYKKLLALTMEGQPGNFYNIGCCRIGLANAYFMLGETKECQTQCDSIFNLPDTPKTKKFKQEAKEIIKRIRVRL